MIRFVIFTFKTKEQALKNIARFTPRALAVCSDRERSYSIYEYILKAHDHLGAGNYIIPPRSKECM
jgi:hypothetical protein